MKNKLLCASKQILLCCIKVLNAYARFCFVLYVAITYQFHAHMVFSGMRSLNTVESIKYLNIIECTLSIRNQRRFAVGCLFYVTQWIIKNQFYNISKQHLITLGLDELLALMWHFLNLRYDLGTNIKSKISVSCICINKNRMTFWIKATWV